MSIVKHLRIPVRLVVALVLLTLVGAVTELMLPTLLARMIDRGVVQGVRGTVLALALVMAVLALVSCAATIASTTISARISTGFAAELRRKLFYKVQEFSAAETDQFGTASLVTRSTSDVANVQTFLTLLLQLGVLAPLTLVAGLVLSVVTGGALSLVLVVAIPVLVAVSMLIIRRLASYSKLMRKKLDVVNRVFLETIEGVRPIRAFRRENTEVERFYDANADYAQTSISQGRLMALLVPAVTLIFGLTNTGVLGVGAGLVAGRGLEVGALVANVQYVSMILISVMMVSAVVMMFPNFDACATRIGEVLDCEVSVWDGEATLEERSAVGTLEFRNVTFAYPGASEAAISDLSFVAEPGTTTAIIGPTGSGKSSLLKLVPRLYDATIGEVLVDGLDVRDYALGDLRSLMGYVPQKNVLFSGDIASNLSWGDDQGGEEDWEYALDMACATEFVSQKQDGVYAAVSQGGTNFSGGQRQRLAIARALMRPAEFYLFDDSFSALDMRTDRTLRANIRRNLGDATVLIVAQRVGTIIDADQIIVLDEGVCVGRGTHQELLHTCELYRELATLQLGEDEVMRTLKEPLTASRHRQPQARSVAERVPAPAASEPVVEPEPVVPEPVVEPESVEVPSWMSAAADDVFAGEPAAYDEPAGYADAYADGFAGSEGPAYDGFAPDPVTYAEPEPEPVEYMEPEPVAFADDIEPEPEAYVEPEPQPSQEPPIPMEPVSLPSIEPVPEPVFPAAPQVAPEPESAPEPEPEPEPVPEPLVEPAAPAGGASKNQQAREAAYRRPARSSRRGFWGTGE